MPREDPRQRYAARRRRGDTGRGAPRGYAQGLDRVWTKARTLQPSPVARWLGVALVLVIIGAGAGWLAGRWDAGSWIGRQYAAAAEVFQSITAAPATGGPQAALSPETSSPAPDSGASAGVDSDNMTVKPSTEPTVVDPRPVSPAPRPGEERTVTDTPATDDSGSRSASLVPIRPSAGAASAATAPAVATPAAAAATGSRPEEAEGRQEEPAKPPSAPWSVLDVQRELARLGYYEGGLDGMVGPLTREAVRTFQRDSGLRPTGRIEPTLVSELASRSTASGSSTGMSRKSP